MIEVIHPGLYTTIQDEGRFGSQQYGVSVSGAMDTLSYNIGQYVLQQENFAALELTMIGGTYTFHQNTVIAITGANMQPICNGRSLPMNKAIAIQAGDTIQLHYAQNGMRTYIAVKGGIDVPRVLHSRSTYTKARIGGFHGRPLQKGDLLPLNVSPSRTCSSLQVAMNHPLLQSPLGIRLMPSTETSLFTKNSLNALTNTPFTITNEADRMGYRLQSDAPIEMQQPKSLLSEAVTFGTMQVPPNGQPIILMADRQTTGGYPKIAQIASVDLPKLAQTKPGTTIHFEWISIERAQQLLIKQQKQLRLLQQLLK